MSTGQYQNPYREGFREKRGQLQIMRYKYGDFEIWETIPEVLPDGSVMRKVGEEVELDCGTYKVIDVTDSGALCESTARKVVEYTTDGGKEVKFTAKVRGCSQKRMGQVMIGCGLQTLKEGCSSDPQKALRIAEAMMDAWEELSENQ